jgi:hypothetical protein
LNLQVKQEIFDCNQVLNLFINIKIPVSQLKERQGVIPLNLVSKQLEMTSSSTEGAAFNQGLPLGDCLRPPLI